MKRLAKIGDLEFEKVIHWRGYDVYMPASSEGDPVPVGKVMFLEREGKFRLATPEEFDEIILLIKD